ncbi:MAG: U32 family peptidase [Treponema sp.]|nr:U32 family peptidase [Treponema sp.]
MTELLAPAGNSEALDAAIGEGADAVYLGLKTFNARSRAANFAWNQFDALVHAVHRYGKKVYVTLNTICEEREMERLYQVLSYLNKVGPDAVIVQDFAVLRMVEAFFPHLAVHASTQMNVASARAMNILAKQGVKRVVLARELGLAEIEAIKQSTTAQVELFVHGALCVSESGLCLFSSFLGGKSANRGMCTQACRRRYTADGADGQSSGYYFSPCDLQLIENIPDLMNIGVDSFKIEGRMKSAEYVGSVVAAYRYVMDHWQDDRAGAIATGKRMLSTDFARSKTTYWYGFQSVDDGVHKAGQLILNPQQTGGTGIALGKITAVKSISVPESTAVSNEQSGHSVVLARLAKESYAPEPGDSIRLHRQDDSDRKSHKVRFVELNDDGSSWIDIPHGFGNGDSVYLLQTKSMSKRYRHVLPADLSPYTMQPVRERLPVLDITPVTHNELNYFPEGLYIQVSRLRDIFIVQAAHPVRVIVELNSETAADMIQRTLSVPLSKKQIYVSLDPFCPAAAETQLSETIEALIADGYTQFVANNIAHLSLLRGKPVSVIAGPYLYTFNRWAVSWLENQRVGAFIMPYENSRHNLEETFEPSVRARVLVPIFAYPALFRMRFQKPESYDFTYFSDKAGSSFQLISHTDGSFVLPDAPFSIVDKVPLLSSAGFKRVLIDFSKSRVTKSSLKLVMSALAKGQPIPGCQRFNWKEGFYVQTQPLAGGQREAPRLGTSPTAARRCIDGKRTRPVGKKQRS